MSEPLPVLRPEAPGEVCRMLRTKTYFGAYEAPGAAWQEGESSTAVFWCLHTMSPAGPDEKPAHPRECRDGRACFERELD